MLFHSFQFLIFFPIVYCLYLILPHKQQNRMLLFASYVFYGAWNWHYVFLLFGSTIVDYLCALKIERSKEHVGRKKFLFVSILTNLSLLGVLKYYDFFALEFQNFMAVFGISVQPFFLNFILPIGISFYTFQTMSYTIDVFRGKLKAEKNFLDYALYVSFFPQLIAGPIERGTRLLPQIQSPRTIDLDKISRGCYLFLWGLFLKIYIGDNLAPIVESVFQSTGPYDGVEVLIASYAFGFQVYCDFAGYSFMAIGLALVMGIELMENFRRPFFSRDISDFWRRWHISLSSWFRDYFFSPVYMRFKLIPWLNNLPLKRRHGVVFFLTLLVTLCLLGFWHGAGWNYVLFGVYHAFAVGFYYLVRCSWKKMPVWLQLFLTFHLVTVGWLFFRAASVEQTLDLFYALFFIFHFQIEPEFSTMAFQAAGLVCILLAVQVLQEWKGDTFVVLKWPRPIRYAFFILIGCLIMIFGNFGERPFIYFQF